MLPIVVLGLLFVCSLVRSLPLPEDGILTILAASGNQSLAVLDNDALPFPRGYKYSITRQFGDTATQSVYMAIVYAMYRVSLTTTIPDNQRWYSSKDFTVPENQSPCIEFRDIATLAADRNKVLFWSLEGLRIKLSGFYANVPLLRITFLVPDQFLIHGSVAKPTACETPAAPELNSIRVSRIPRGQAIKIADIIEAAAKLFKSVFVSITDHPCPPHLLSRAGTASYEYIATPSGQEVWPMTWRDVARATMAILQYLASHDGRGSEVDVVILGPSHYELGRATLRHIKPAVSISGDPLPLAPVNNLTVAL